MEDLITNTYQAIGGTHDHKINTITKWLNEVRNLQPDINTKDTVIGIITTAIANGWFRKSE